MPQEVQQSQTNETKTAPTDVAGQGDAKRKATQGSKKSEKAIEGANIKSDPTMLAANAAAILSSVPPSVAQNVVGQSTESTNPPFDNVLNATYSINSTNSPIAVAPLISNQQPTTINDISPMLHSDMGELMDSSAIHEASQDNSGNKRAVSTRNLTNDERRQRRLLRNRVAAKECRRKKKAYVADLEEKVTRLEEENLRLLKEVEDFNTKLNINALKLEENARLHKEVEELKAKLRHEAQKEKRLKSHDEIEPTKQEATS
ncbi:8130_t:CDS:2 [Funneliformis mosseae]|uniref:8130_t:CDS:1 n=2 Tax=Funneliformis TaxID=1117308 RepID=A0A9N9E166_FUNMO|nr:8130_t:CDS:2 [Funneliformis mosseae]